MFLSRETFATVAFTLHNLVEKWWHLSITSLMQTCKITRFIVFFFGSISNHKSFICRLYLEWFILTHLINKHNLFVLKMNLIFHLTLWKSAFSFWNVFLLGVWLLLQAQVSPILPSEMFSYEAIFALCSDSVMPPKTFVNAFCKSSYVHM